MNKNYSYSSLSCFEQCPYKYKLIYIDDHRIDCPTIATDFGSLIHHIEEELGICFRDNKPINYQTLIEEFNSEATKLENKYPKDFYILDKSGRTYKDKTEYYKSTGIYRLEKRLKNNPNLSVVNLEKEFYLDYKGYMFHGFIDRIFYDKSKNTYIIEDIKTYSKVLTKKELESPLQHLIYSLAVDPDNKYNVSCTYDLPFCDVVQQVSSNYRTLGINNLDNIFQEMKTSNFPPNPTPLCHWCVFSHTYPDQPKEAKGLCPYFILWTKENKTFRSYYRWLGEGAHRKILEEFKKDLDFKKIL